MKKYLPPRFKQFLWFVFKSPQRKHGGPWSLFTDLTGYFTILIKKQALQPITICTGIKNRSDNYLTVFLDSLNNCKNKESISLSVFDCNSSDVSDLQTEIKNKWNGNLIFKSEEVDFTRAHTFNKAMKQASTELLFVCDADMCLPENILEKVNKYVTKKSSWFPISFHLDKSGENGKFKTEGKGIFATSKTQLQKVGPYDENFTSWGDEDWEMFFRFYKNGIRPFRTKERNLIHNYHESKRPKDYKSKYETSNN